MQLMQKFQPIYQNLKRKLISFKPENLAVYHFPNVTENRGQAGRPRVRIEEKTLLHFWNIGYSWKEIAELLLVSKWTILRTVRGYGIENQAGFSSITDDDLDNIRDFKINHGNFVEDL